MNFTILKNKKIKTHNREYDIRICDIVLAHWRSIKLGGSEFLHIQELSSSHYLYLETRALTLGVGFIVIWKCKKSSWHCCEVVKKNHFFVGNFRSLVSNSVIKAFASAEKTLDLIYCGEELLEQKRRNKRKKLKSRQWSREEELGFST